MATGSGTAPTRRTAIATVVAILAAAALLAALLSEATSIADIPKRGNDLEDLWGRTFVAVEATEDGRPYEFPDDWPTSVTFSLDSRGNIAFETACSDLGANWELDDGRFDYRDQPPFFVGNCNKATRPHAEWLEAFMAERPTWRLDGDTLTLASDLATMTMVDEGDGTTPSEILGKRFYTDRTGAVGADEKQRFRADTWLALSFDRDGTMRAKLGCETVAVPTELRTGWLRVTEEIRPESTTDCSRSMAAQETAWLWDFFAHPVQWQAGRGGLALKAYRSDHDLLFLSRAYLKRERRTDPALLAGKTFHSPPISAFHDTLDGHRGVILEIDENGEFAATAGCGQPSAHGTVRAGWLQFGDDLEWTLSACEDVEAEQWLGEFLAHEPTWYTNRYGITLEGGRRDIDLVQAEDYEEMFGEPLPFTIGS